MVKWLWLRDYGYHTGYPDDGCYVEVFIITNMMFTILNIKGGFRLHQCKLGSWISFVDGVHNEPAPEGIHPNAIMMMVSVNIIYDNDHIDIMINVIVVLIVFIRLILQEHKTIY